MPLLAEAAVDASFAAAAILRFDYFRWIVYADADITMMIFAAFRFLMSLMLPMHDCY